MRFSFGKNWLGFSSVQTQRNLESAKNDLELWLGSVINGRTVIDIGSGSGLHSLAFWNLGAKYVVSFDFDEESVKATKKCWIEAGCPENWIVLEGDILSDAFVNSLGRFDIVYSWGVLHHTGEMWRAINNAFSLARENSLIWLSLYQDEKNYERDLKMKINFNRSTWFGKKHMVFHALIKQLRSRRRKGQSLKFWKDVRGRGMSTYFDLVDWIGGYPYEVTSPEKLIDYVKARYGFGLLKYNYSEACAVYLFGLCTEESPLFVESFY